MEGWKSICSGVPLNAKRTNQTPASDNACEKPSTRGYQETPFQQKILVLFSLSPFFLPIKSQRFNSNLISSHQVKSSQVIMKVSARIVVLFLLTAADSLTFSVNAFTSPTTFACSQSRVLHHTTTTMFAQKSPIIEDISKVALSTATVWATATSSASAAGPDWGIFEGKTLSRKWLL